MRPRFLPIALAMVPPLLSACFTYVPADVAAVTPQEEVRVHLDRAGMAGLPEGIPLDGAWLSGRILRQEGDSLVLRVPVASRAEGFGRELRQDVYVAASDVTEVGRRQVDRTKTALVSVAATGAAAGLVLLIMGGTESNVQQIPPGPDQLRIPLLSIPLK